MIFGDKKRLLVLIKTRLTPWIISAFVLLVGFILTAVLWRDAKQHQDKNLNKEFQHASDQVAKSIHSRLDDYEIVMRGVKGYIEGSEKVTIEEFHAYMQTLKLFEKNLV
jgi:CHASE1-domain containing sensor protein